MVVGWVDMTVWAAILCLAIDRVSVMLQTGPAFMTQVYITSWARLFLQYDIDLHYIMSQAFSAVNEASLHDTDLHYIMSLAFSAVNEASLYDKFTLHHEPGFFCSEWGQPVWQVYITSCARLFLLWTRPACMTSFYIMCQAFSALFCSAWSQPVWHKFTSWARLFLLFSAMTVHVTDCMCLVCVPWLHVPCVCAMIALPCVCAMIACALCVCHDCMCLVCVPWLHVPCVCAMIACALCVCHDCMCLVCVPACMTQVYIMSQAFCALFCNDSSCDWLHVPCVCAMIACALCVCHDCMCLVCVPWLHVPCVCAMIACALCVCHDCMCLVCVPWLHVPCVCAMIACALCVCHDCMCLVCVPACMTQVYIMSQAFCALFCNDSSCDWLQCLVQTPWVSWGRTCSWSTGTWWTHRITRSTHRSASSCTSWTSSSCLHRTSSTITSSPSCDRSSGRSVQDLAPALLPFCVLSWLSPSVQCRPCCLSVLPWLSPV